MRALFGIIFGVPAAILLYAFLRVMLAAIWASPEMRMVIWIGLGIIAVAALVVLVWFAITAIHMHATGQLKRSVARRAA
jgi:hypothetical protein